MIVGTAGHIDHGKTTLVRALTGVDTDRLAEERRRGMTIDLGFAYADVPTREGRARRIGFVDVPGHERLVHTMVAGASGIDVGLLVVAADDGPMPQTLEHLAVLRLLEVPKLVVALSKCDVADDAQQAASRAAIAALLDGTRHAQAPIVPTAAGDAATLDALRQALLDAAPDPDAVTNDGDDPQAALRLPIDRVFTLDGIGTVAAGSMRSGRVQAQDAVQIVPDGPAARVRSLRVDGRGQDTARRGERVALALAGIERASLRRGQWVCAPHVALQTARLDVALQAASGPARRLASGQHLHLHIGCDALPVSLALLDDAPASAGGMRFAQLIAQRPLAAWHGDRFVLRDAAAGRVVAGGTVLDPMAPARLRRTPQRLAQLQALMQPTPAARVAALLAASPLGVALAPFARGQGRALAGLATPAGVVRVGPADAAWCFSSDAAAALQRAALTALAAFHRERPDEAGPDAARWRRLVAPRLDAVPWAALVERWHAAGDVLRLGACWALPEQGAQLSAIDTRIAQKVAPHIASSGLEGAWVRDLAAAVREPESLLRPALARLARQGALHAVVKDLYIDSATAAGALRVLQGLAAGDTSAGITAAAFRDATGLGRKRAIQLLEHFDRIGALRRVGDAHRIRADSAWWEACAAPAVPPGGQSASA